MDNCPLCHSNNIALKYTCKDKLISGLDFPLMECYNCEFIFTANIPAREKIGDYYKSKDYISHSDTRKGLINKLYHIVRQQMLKKKASLVIKYSKKSKGCLLDIGSATGYFPGFMKKKGWKAQGVESDQEAAKFASENFGISIQKLEDLYNSTDKSYDAITLWHVLEHLYEPKSLLPVFDSLLNDKGILVIALPNNHSYDSKAYKEEWAAWDVPRHLWHFNICSFKEFIKDSPFEIIAIKKMPLDGFYVSVLSERNKNSSLALIKGFIVGFLGWFLSLFRIHSSSSLIYVLRKKD